MAAPIRRTFISDSAVPARPRSPLSPGRRRALAGLGACAIGGLAALASPAGTASASLPSGAGLVLNAPIAGMASTPDGHGYWEDGTDGGIFAFGTAQYFGSTGSLTLNRPIVGMSSTPDGRGYWEVASDGGVFAFGDAQFHGSTGSVPLDRPIVGMTSTKDGRGYWEVASDGGVFAFGDARFLGSAAGMSPDSPIVGMAATSDGRGYWEANADGSVYAFGDARFAGSAPLGKPIVGISAEGSGYRLAADDGGIFAFGGAGFYGSLAGSTVRFASASAPIVPNDGVTPVQVAMWDRVNMCEEGGRWNVEGPTFSGGLGFSHASWDRFNTFGYPADAADATPDQQIRVAVAFAEVYYGSADAAPDQNGCAGY